ncbi:MAG: hypothetical protein Q8M92_00490, partial [Candidatus Subteraquimicrobiales bacterium]|nr:hypothetical protein [Candidatus Subteraquimicrobiales bacterium]
ERKKTAPNIIQLVSPQQLAKIEHLKADIKWHVHDGYQRWLKKYLKKDRIATSREANNVIEAMKGMRERQQSTTPAPPYQGGERGGDVECYRDGFIRGNGRVQW